MVKSKIKLFILFLALILLISGCSPKQPPQPSQPQVWQKTFGGNRDEETYSIQQTSDTGYIIAGATYSFGAGGWDVYILKLDSNGELVWQKTFGGSGEDEAYSIQQTSDGGYIVAGATSWTLSYGMESDIYILKLDANGELVWQKTIDKNYNDWANSIQQTKDGGYIVAGWTKSYGEKSDIYILKLDVNGELMWQKTIGGSNDEWALSILQTSDEGYIVAGYTYSFGAGGSDIYLIKLNKYGEIVWQKTFGGNSNDWAYSIQQTNDGGYIIAGSTRSFGAGDSDVYILKLNANGNLVWQKTFGGSNDEGANSIQQTSDGGYIVAGGTFIAGSDDVYILKLDNNGNLVWQKTYGGGSDDWANSIQQTNDGGYIVAGYTRSFGAGGSDVYVIKLDADGNTGPYPQLVISDD